MKILKFGGTSLKDSNTIRSVMEIIKSNNSCGIVVSAVLGTTDQLLNLIQLAEVGESYSFDLKRIIILLLKQKKLISFFSILGFILSILISFFSEKVYEGQFQIVLSRETLNNSRPSNANSVESIYDYNPYLSNRQNINLETQVEILKSSSILLDTFQNLKSFQQNIRDKKNRKLNFHTAKRVHLLIDQIINFKNFSKI